MDYITYNIIFTEIMTNNIEITENAQIHIADLLKNDDSKFFRITVQGGGCAGFQYKWGTSKKDDLNETWKDIEGILLVDPIAEMYIIGSIVDYKTELGGSYLTVNNPGATSSCGCGESFGV